MLKRCRAPLDLPLCVVVALVAAVAGCADDGGAEGGEAVEAREQNEVLLDGVAYRVPTFRQLNPRIEPDDTFYDGPPPGEGSGVYAAFIQACNPQPPVETPSSRIFLEDAFGERFDPVEQPDNELAYHPRPLQAGACLPSESAATTADGAVLAFIVPFESTAERPMILVIRGKGAAERRIRLDL